MTTAGRQRGLADDRPEVAHRTSRLRECRSGPRRPTATAPASVGVKAPPRSPPRIRTGRERPDAWRACGGSRRAAPVRPRRPYPRLRGDDVHRDHEAAAPAAARHDAADEEAAHRDVGDEPVDQEADAGRDDRGDHAEAGGHGRARPAVAPRTISGTSILASIAASALPDADSPPITVASTVHLGQAADPVADQRVGEPQEAAA